MKVDLINHYVHQFAQHLEHGYEHDELYKYECLANFQQHWNLAADDLAAMYDLALSSRFSSRLWGGSKHSAKSMMLEFARLNPAYTIAAFRDLFRLDTDVMMRSKRFIFHCDQLLEELRAKHLRYNTHHHDRSTIVMYLALRFPDHYCLYDYPCFSKALLELEAKKIPAEYELDRFFKLTNILYGFLMKHPDVSPRYEKILSKQFYYRHSSHMMTFDFYQFVARHKA